MELSIKHGYSTRRFLSIDFPVAGETVSEHSVKLNRKGDLRREIHVGRTPWGAEGEKQGTSCEGRVVAKLDERNNKSAAVFDRLLFDLAVEVVQAAEEGSAEHRAAGRVVFSMREYNIVPPPAPVECPNCHRNYDTELSRSQFGEAATFMWFTSDALYDPARLSLTVCVDCLEGLRKSLETEKAEAEKTVALGVDELMMKGTQTHHYTGVGTSWDHAIGKVKARIYEIRRTA